MGPTLKKLKARIERSPQDARGYRRYDDSLKEAVRRYGRQRLKGGRTKRGIAEELGLSADTLWGWLEGKPTAACEVAAAEEVPRELPPAPPSRPAAPAAIEIRAVLAAQGERARTTPYPAELRPQAVAYLQERQAGGASLSEVARELKIGADALRRWRGGQARVVRPIRVVAEPVVSTLVVHGPSGLRIEGLDLCTVAKLIKELSC